MSARRKKYLPSLTNIYNAHAIVRLSAEDMDRYLDYIEDYIQKGGKFSWRDIREFSFDTFNIYIHDAPPPKWDKSFFSGVYLTDNMKSADRIRNESYCKVRILNRSAPLSCDPPYINREILDTLEERGMDVSWQRLFTFNASLLNICLCIKLGGYDRPFKNDSALSEHIAKMIARSYNETFVKNCLDLAQARPSFWSRHDTLVSRTYEHLKDMHERYKTARRKVESWHPVKT